MTNEQIKIHTVITYFVGLFIGLFLAWFSLPMWHGDCYDPPERDASYDDRLEGAKRHLPPSATNFHDWGNGWISFDIGPAHCIWKFYGIDKVGGVMTFVGPSEWYREFHEFEDELKRLRETPAPKPTDNPDRRTADATSGT